MASDKSITFDILPSGGIRFSCGSKEQNNAIKEILAEMGYDKINDLEQFFSQSDNIKLLIGQEILCG